MISLASRAAQLFERSKAEQKRELIAFVFSNPRLKGKKLEFSLRSPFDLMVNRRDHSSWLAFLRAATPAARTGGILARLHDRAGRAYHNSDLACGLLGIWLEHVLKEFTDELTNAHARELCLER